MVSKSFKVIQGHGIWHQLKGIYDFLLVTIKGLVTLAMSRTLSKLYGDGQTKNRLRSFILTQYPLVTNRRTEMLKLIQRAALRRAVIKRQPVRVQTFFIFLVFILLLYVGSQELCKGPVM